jgi:hypothetical protein
MSLCFSCMPHCKQLIALTLFTLHYVYFLASSEFEPWNIIMRTSVFYGGI